MNNNNNNSSNAEDSIDARRARFQKRVEEQQTLRNILAAVRERLETSSTVTDTMKSPEWREKKGAYSAEQERLQALNNLGLKEGVAAGLLTFIMLRRGPALLQRFFESRRRGGGGSFTGGYQLDRNASQQSPQQRGVRVAILGGMKLGLDVFVSFLMAASISFSFTNETVLVNEVVKIPLVPGRSLVSDELCTTIQDQVKKYGLGSHSNNKIDSVYLQAVTQFAHNCSRRQSYEVQLRQQEGRHDDKSSSIPIPPPGVPDDFDSSFTAATPQQYNGGTYDQDKAMTFSDDDDNYFGNNNINGTTDPDETKWGDDMTTDQEDWKKK